MYIDKNQAELDIELFIAKVMYQYEIASGNMIQDIQLELVPQNAGEFQQVLKPSVNIVEA